MTISSWNSVVKIKIYKILEIEYETNKKIIQKCILYVIIVFFILCLILLILFGLENSKEYIVGNMLPEIGDEIEDINQYETLQKIHNQDVQEKIKPLFQDIRKFKTYYYPYFNSCIIKKNCTDKMRQEIINQWLDPKDRQSLLFIRMRVIKNYVDHDELSSMSNRAKSFLPVILHDQKIRKLYHWDYDRGESAQKIIRNGYTKVINVLQKSFEIMKYCLNEKYKINSDSSIKRVTNEHGNLIRKLTRQHTEIVKKISEETSKALTQALINPQKNDIEKKKKNKFTQPFRP